MGATDAIPLTPPFSSGNPAWPQPGAPTAAPAAMPAAMPAPEVASHAQAGSGSRVKAARKAAGLSQSDLAQAAGVTRQTIGLIEAGSYNPTLKLCLAICKTLGYTLDQLFWE